MPCVIDSPIVGTGTSIFLPEASDVTAAAVVLEEAVVEAADDATATSPDVSISYKLEPTEIFHRKSMLKHG